LPTPHDIAQLQQDVAKEIRGDASSIAVGVFGDSANHPDVQQVPNQRYDDLVRQKFVSGSPSDRDWLTSEAQRDPVQFLKVADRIGAKLPEPMPFGVQNTVPPQAATPVAPTPLPAAAPTPIAPPPMTMPAPLPTPVPIAPPMPGGTPVPGIGGPPAPPVILGPNGQPLPPTGM
jgi:hypothetical protein